MARQRFQTGQLKLRGKKGKQKWIGRWREDVIRADGSIHRIRKNEVLGTLKEYKTRRLALRELQRRLAEVNSVTSKARPVATFREFATNGSGTF